MITFLGLFGLYYAVTGIRFAMVKSQPSTLLDKVITALGLFARLEFYFLRDGSIRRAISILQLFS